MTSMRAAAVLVVISLALTACDDVCGEFQLSTPESDAFYADDPDLRYPRSGTETCGALFGIQGNWYDQNGVATIAFTPSGGDTAASFSSMWIDASFATADAVPGRTLTVPPLSGQAFTGLGSTHRDIASLRSGSITFHAVGEPSGDGVFPVRVIEIEWDLVWTGNPGVRYATQGKDELDMYVTD